MGLRLVSSQGVDKETHWCAIRGILPPIPFQQRATFPLHNTFAFALWGSSACESTAPTEKPTRLRAGMVI